MKAGTVTIVTFDDRMRSRAGPQRRSFSVRAGRRSAGPRASAAVPHANLRGPPAPGLASAVRHRRQREQHPTNLDHPSDNEETIVDLKCLNAFDFEISTRCNMKCKYCYLVR